MRSPVRLACHNLPDLLQGVGTGDLRVAAVRQHHLRHACSRLPAHCQPVHARLLHAKRCAASRGATHVCQHALVSAHEPTSPESWIFSADCQL